MPGTLHHIPIFVHDMDRSLHLFRDLLDFEVRWHRPRAAEPIIATLLDIPNAEVEMAYLQNGTDPVAIELIRLLHPPPKTQAIIGNGKPGTMGLSIAVQNIKDLYNRLITEGWPPHTDMLSIRPPDVGHLNVFCFRTDEGVPIEIIEMAPEKTNR